MNGIPSDNRLKNLRYGTRGENMRDKPSAVRARSASKITEGDVLKIRSLLSDGVCKHVVARAFRLSWAAIHAIAIRKNWGWVS